MRQKRRVDWAGLIGLAVLLALAAWLFIGQAPAWLLDEKSLSNLWPVILTTGV